MGRNCFRRNHINVAQISILEPHHHSVEILQFIADETRLTYTTCVSDNDYYDGLQELYETHKTIADPRKRRNKRMENILRETSPFEKVRFNVDEIIKILRSRKTLFEVSWSELGLCFYDDTRHHHGRSIPKENSSRNNGRLYLSLIRNPETETLENE